MNLEVEIRIMLKITFLVLCMVLSEVKSEVSVGFRACLADRRIFYGNFFPSGFPDDDNHYKYICQLYKNNYRFASLYSLQNRIPVYSAYTAAVTCEDFHRTTANWFIEPQISEEDSNLNAMSKEQDFKPKDYRTRAKQARNVDYQNSGYDKGHLFPRSYACSNDDQKATFTLTNAVPQVTSFNTGSWNRAEDTSKTIMKDHCNLPGDERYFITGAIPSEHNTINNRVNIPDEMWTAACCQTNDERTFTFGFYALNDIDTDNENVNLMELTALQARLRNHYNKGHVRMFTGKCNDVAGTVPEFVKEAFDQMGEID